MKRFTTIFTVMLMAALSLSLVSCDEDAEVAATLAGTWQGNVYAYSRYNGREYRAAESKVQFNSGYNSGDGYWIDYYNDAPYSYQASHITWHVRNTNIYIHFEEDNTNVVIYNYRLSDDRLSGYIQTGNGQMLTITLYHTYSPNWSSYTFDDYDYDSYYGYAKSRTSGTATGRPQRFFSE